MQIFCRGFFAHKKKSKALWKGKVKRSNWSHLLIFIDFAQVLIDLLINKSINY